MSYLVSNINPKKTAVLVIDMTNDYVAPGAPLYCDMGNKLAQRLNSFLDDCRNLGIRIIYTSHMYRADQADMPKVMKEMVKNVKGPVCESGTEGVEIYKECPKRADEIVIAKHHYNAFHATDLDIILRSWEIENVAISGVCSDVCCMATAREALFNGYKVLTLFDLLGAGAMPDAGFGSFSAEQHHLAAMNSLAATNGNVLESPEFLSLARAFK